MGSGEFYWGWAEEARRALLDTGAEGTPPAAKAWAHEGQEPDARVRRPEGERSSGRDPE